MIQLLWIAVSLACAEVIFRHWAQISPYLAPHDGSLDLNASRKGAEQEHALYVSMDACFGISR